jgi:hypothetical protein
MRAVFFGLLLLGSAARADDAAGRVERRLAVQKQLLESTGTGCHFLSVLSRAMPERVTLSRLSYQRVPGVLSLELSQGTKDDAESLLGALQSAQLCSSLTVKEEKKVVKGSCTFPGTAQKKTVRGAATLGDEAPSALRTRLDEYRVRIPDAAETPALESAMREAATQYGVSDLTVVFSSPRTTGPVDAVQYILHARAPSVGAFAFVCELGLARRLTSVESIDFGAPRAEKAEWSVELTLGVTSWRYRVEDEKNDVTLETVKTAPVPKLEAFAIAPRSPFGPANVVFTGAKRDATGDECRDALDAVKPVSPEARIEAFAVAWASSGCAMLVDDKAGCHLWKQGANGPDRFKLTGLDKGYVALKRAVTNEQGEVVPQVRYLLVPPRPPPANACPRK